MLALFFHRWIVQRAGTRSLDAEVTPLYDRSIWYVLAIFPPLDVDRDQLFSLTNLVAFLTQKFGNFFWKMLFSSASLNNV